MKALEKDYYKSDKWKHIKNEFVITRENKEAINELRKIKSEIIAKDNAKEIKEILNDISNRLNPINPKISKINVCNVVLRVTISSEDIVADLSLT